MQSHISELQPGSKIRKVAKIWTGVSIALVLFVAITSLIAPEPEGMVAGAMPLIDYILPVLFPVISLVAMALAFRWELPGSLTALGSALLFFTILSIDRARFMPEMFFMILVIVFPAMLFLWAWNLDRKREVLPG